MSSPNLSKPSSIGAAPSPTPTAQVRTSTSAVILAIVVLNTLGIVLLFFKLDWDVRQISAEIGLVRDAVKAEKVVRERAVMKGEDASSGIPYSDDGIDGYVLTQGLGGLPLWYPGHFYVEPRRLNPDSGQISLVVTNLPGKLSWSPEIGGDVETFDSGYEMRVHQITSEEYSSLDMGVDLNALPTNNPLVKSVYAECVGDVTEEGYEDCFFETYIVQFRGDAYRIDVFASGDDVNAKEITDEMIRRIGQ